MFNQYSIFGNVVFDLVILVLNGYGRRGVRKRKGEEEEKGEIQHQKPKDK